MKRPAAAFEEEKMSAHLKRPPCAVVKPEGAAPEAKTFVKMKCPTAAIGEPVEAEPEEKLSVKMKRPAAAVEEPEEAEPEESISVTLNQLSAVVEELEEAEPDETMSLTMKRPAAAVDKSEEAESEEKMSVTLKRPAAAAVERAEAELEEKMSVETKRFSFLAVKRPASVLVEPGESEPDEKIPVRLKRPAAASDKPKEDSPGDATPKVAEANAQTEEAKPRKVNKTQEFLNVVRRTMLSIPFKAPCVAGLRLHPAVLTSFDEDGFPSMRTVIPYEVAGDFSDIRVRTDMATRKVQEIQTNSKVSLHYQDQRGRGGWVTFKGDAKIVIAGNDLVEIVIRPERCECMSYVDGPTSADNGEGWKPAVAIRPAGGDTWRRSH